MISKELKLSQEFIESEISQQLREIKHMANLCNNIINTSLETNDINFKNKTIIVVDDGAAIMTVRKNMDPKRLIIVIPTSPKGTISILKNENIDNIEVITSPQNRNFILLQQYYQNFDQITYKQVIDIIRRNLENHKF